MMDIKKLDVAAYSEVREPTSLQSLYAEAHQLHMLDEIAAKWEKVCEVGDGVGRLYIIRLVGLWGWMK